MAEGRVGRIFEGRQYIEVWKILYRCFPERRVSFFQRGLAFAPERSERVGLILFLLSGCLRQVRTHARLVRCRPSFLLVHSRPCEFARRTRSMLVITPFEVLSIFLMSILAGLIGAV